MSGDAIPRTDSTEDGFPFDWAVVRTKPNREVFATKMLELRNLEVYCPRILLNRWHSRAPRGPVPLFATYLFVQQQPNVSAYTLSYCGGVQGPLVINGVLAKVENGVVEAFKVMEGERGYILHEDLDRGLELGCLVDISGGSLDGIRGVFRGFVNGKDRARILVDFLRRQMILEVDSIRLTPVVGNV
jgi:hypothetical protein